MSQIHDVLYAQDEYREMAKWFRETNPYCNKCKAWTEPRDRTVDHITPLSFRPDTAYVRANLQMLCKDCHKEKTTVRDNHFNNTMMLAFLKASLA